MTRQFFICLMLFCCLGKGLPQSSLTKEGQEHANNIVASLPPDNFLRRLVQGGAVGDGIERPWQVLMPRFKIKAARVEVYMVWFFGPKWLKPVRVVYYSTYDGHEQITDPVTLANIRASGLERQIRQEAVRIAPNGHWIDLPAPVFWPFRAAAAVTFWDDPWLPTPPGLFTTFGPGRPPLVAAVGFGDLADIDRLLASGKLDHQAINNALWFACGDRNPTILQRLVKAGADINQSRPGEEFATCLMSAIWSNAPETVKVLVTYGAKVNGAQGEYNETPLTLAASMGDRSVGTVKMLLDAAADVRAANSYGLTALIKAADRQSETSSVLELLISHGAQVNARTRTGRTALAFAAERGNVEAVKALLRAQADVNVRDERGRSALDVATSKQIAELLIVAGAKK